MNPRNMMAEQNEDAVYDYMKAHRGIRFTRGQIARHLSLFPLSLETILKKLVDLGRVMLTTENNHAVYYVLTELEEQAVIRQEMAVAFKPLSKSYIEAMQRALHSRD